MSAHLSSREAAIDVASSTAEHEFVKLGRARHAVDYPGQKFDAPYWDVRHLRTSAARQTNPRAYFTRYGTLDEPIPGPFADVVRAYLVLYRRGLSNLGQRLDGARMLWRAIEQRRGGPGQEGLFRWESLVAGDVRVAERLMRNDWSASTTHKIASQLVAMVRILGERKICPVLHLDVETPRPEDSSRRTLTGEEERMRYRPSDAALRAVIDVYRNRDLGSEDRLLICLTVILLCTGLRIGEAITLSARPLTKRRGTVGLRYWKEKSIAGAAACVFWTTALQAELLVPAIEEVQALTAAARVRARVLEANPHCVPLPEWVSGAVELTSAEVAQLLGMRSYTSVNAIPADRLPRRVVSPQVSGRRTRRGSVRQALFRVDDVADYLQQERTSSNVLAQRDDGSPQVMSDSLFIVFRNFLQRQREANRLLVEPVSPQHLSDSCTGARVATGRRSYSPCSLGSTFEIAMGRSWRCGRTSSATGSCRWPRPAALQMPKSRVGSHAPTPATWRRTSTSLRENVSAGPSAVSGRECFGGRWRTSTRRSPSTIPRRRRLTWRGQYKRSTSRLWVSASTTSR
jgi:hypothetical protein